MLEDIRAGLTAKEAGSKHGVGASTARKWARQAGVELDRVRPAKTRAEAVELIGQGASVAEAAARFGCHPATIRVWCQEAGQRIPGSAYDHETRELAVRRGGGAPQRCCGRA